MADQPPYGPQYQQPWLPPAGPQDATQQFPAAPGGQRARPPRKQHRTRNALLAAIGALLVIGVIANAVGGKTPAATSPKATTATTAPAQETLAQKIKDWNSNGGQSGLNAIQAALDSIQQQGSAGNFTGMAQACAELSSAVSNTEAAGPIPYRPAERWFARGLAKYDQAASECQAGASSQDATAMQRAATDFSEGNADVARADKTIKALSGA